MASLDQRVCSSCGGTNPPDAKFCARCGTGLAAVCGSCGHGNLPDASFCTECGGPLVTTSASGYASPQAYTPAALAEKIRRGGTQLEGERKQITVLFADVIGSTGIAERLDPEDMRTILHRSFDVMLEQIHRYEGTVSQFLGDGLLALFGAPIAHEDHAQRAARAALDIQAALEPIREELRSARDLDLRFRIGLHSGPVVVGHVGVDLSMDYLAVGDTMNMGARIQAAAPPGSVVVSEATRQLIEGYFVLRDLGEQELKGKGRQHVYEVERPNRLRSRVDIEAERGLGPFVGRAHELTSLHDAFERARGGTGQVVLVSGEPGIGKSRLLHEFRSAHAGADAAWRVGRCISYGTDIPYLPIIDVLKDAYRIDEADDDEAVAQKVREGVRLSGADPGVAPLLVDLLDAGDGAAPQMDPQFRKARTFEALRTVALTAAAHRPLVLTIEDAHWIDPASTEYLSFLIEAIPDHRILLLLSHRPGWLQPFGDAPHLQTIGLRSLSNVETVEVASAVVGASLPTELEDLVFRKADGNPFFVEEVTKSLIEADAIRRDGDGYVLTRPLADLDVPDTVQDVIMARLDRLPDEPKRALQTASVIGREFTLRLWERSADISASSGDVRELRSLELIFERSLYPELVYMFKHALTHDVAYQSLLLERRRILHGVVADAIAELYADRLAEQVETLAYHYERAERWDEALDHLILSGEKAMTNFMPHEAVGFFERADAIVQAGHAEVDPQRLMTMYQQQGDAYLEMSVWDRSAASFQAMREVAQREGDADREGFAFYSESFAQLWGHRFEEALTLAEAAERSVEGSGNPAVRAGAAVMIALVRALTGELIEATGFAEDAKRLADDADASFIRGLARCTLGELLHWRGREDDALAAVSEALELGRAEEIPYLLLWGGWDDALMRCGSGDYDGSLAALREVLALSKQLGDRALWCRTLNTFGWVYIDLCNWELALDHNGRGAEASREFGDPEIIRNAELNLADCHLATGELEEAERLLEGVQEASRASGTWGEEWMKWRYSQHTDASLAELRLAQGDLSRARHHADRCIAAAEATDSKRNVVKGRRASARIALREGRLDDADRELARAAEIARAIGNPAQLWTTLAALGDLRDAQGRVDEARAARREAIDVIDRVAANLADPGIRDTFLRSPQVTAIREAA
ncbi:MAG TPA: adenylate/guanylate cyclase domain-containing protein [Actinomycetota bacterium]|nr:adenylate/guanylate cyclase domain-containing protein [Actinomycetota bacterium]